MGIKVERLFSSFTNLFQNTLTFEEARYHSIA